MTRVTAFRTFTSRYHLPAPCSASCRTASECTGEVLGAHTFPAESLAGTGYARMRHAAKQTSSNRRGSAKGLGLYTGEAEASTCAVYCRFGSVCC